ncbi:MAG TPA: alpha-N-acetylglucosaminidase C-terminal domain-containing protein, partial [Magnetospirillaceae bacterium]|nr:alpha-N-acetylglucosaminidase C-terminal domain-containing protein [Magnetospirillaceae bacterium]
IDHDRIAHDDRKRDFQNAPFLYGGLWEFGGRTTFGGALGTIAERLPRMAKTNANMAGTALFTEGLDTNPFAFDLFTELAWRAEAPDLGGWTDEYVRRRYGAADPHGLAAWSIIRRTAYDLKVDETIFNSERDAAAENLLDAQPSLTATMVSNWSPTAPRYDTALFARALTELLAVAPDLRTSETYRYDLVDVARQCLANEARRMLPHLKDRKRWLKMLDLQDKLLATDRFFLLGTWLAPVKGWASSPQEAQRLDHDARSILTTWGGRKASDEGPLHDYGNKDWAGLTGDYYKKRWELYFKDPAKPIDWYAFGEKWNRSGKIYPDQPRGDTYAVASEIARFLGAARPKD